MNLSGWSSPLSPFYPSNYYSYPYYPTGGMLNSSIQTSLNSSSGYESANNETSFIDPHFPVTSSFIKEPNYNVIQHVNEAKKRSLDDSETEEFDTNMGSMTDEQNYQARKKRRVLSRPQRQEANRRERHRMEIINQAYEDLRNALPFKKGRKRQKMSRMDTVDGAIRYIQTLLETLHGPNYNPDWTQ
ncbi:hypothetical protein I4U23_002522 [Adineta vaga]|nr:hypothetical protein I4U23_002522 [Adineta vaga]